MFFSEVFFALIFSAMLIFVIDIFRRGQLLLLPSLLQERPAQADQVRTTLTVTLFTNLDWVDWILGSCFSQDLTFLLF